jgi:hypothetical protein
MYRGPMTHSHGEEYLARPPRRPPGAEEFAQTYWFHVELKGFDRGSAERCHGLVSTRPPTGDRMKTLPMIFSSEELLD